jgi:hypothetical protein
MLHANRLRMFAAGLFFPLALASNAGAEVKLTIKDGQVFLMAKDATVRQILETWARVGQTKIVNIEKIPGGPISLQLEGVSERTALEVVLRSVSGYVAAPRPIAVPDASAFDRIMVMPTSVAPPPLPVQAARPGAAPNFPQPVQQPQPFEDDDQQTDDDAPAVAPPPGRAPVFAPFNQPQNVNPAQGGMVMPGGMAPAQQQLPPGALIPNTPGTPGTTTFGGTPMPGMIVQPPPGSPNPNLPQSPRPPSEDDR